LTNQQEQLPGMPHCSQQQQSTSRQLHVARSPPPGHIQNFTGQS
jgi:hypothetical protein